VTLRGLDGELRCAFDHDPKDRRDLHLGTAALLPLGESVYLLSCSWDCDHFFVYRLGALEGDCAPTLVSEVHVAQDPDVRTDGGAGDDAWGPYNAFAAFLGNAGEVYLVASQHHWLDTWRLDGLGSAEMGLVKLASSRWEAPDEWEEEGLFLEGMAVVPSTSSAVTIWAAPHDYGREGCGSERVCTRAIYRCDKVLGDGAAPRTRGGSGAEPGQRASSKAKKIPH